MTEDLDCMVDLAAQALSAESGRYRTSPLPGPLTLASLETLLRAVLEHILESPNTTGPIARSHGLRAHWLPRSLT